MSLNHYLTYFKTVIVPIAKPENASHMLAIAVQLIEREAGKVIVLTVAVGEDEGETNDRIEAITPIVQRFKVAGYHMEMVTQIASSVTRGILDGAREHGAETLIIGVHKFERRQVKLGNVVENIIQAAPCNVLVYRPSHSPDYHRVVVPLTSSLTMPVALEMGVLLAHSQDSTLTPLYIQRDYSSNAEREELINATLAKLSADKISKNVITGRNPAEKILAELTEDDLLVLGFSQKSALDEQFDNDITNTLLNRAAGPVLIASQILEERGTWRGILQRSLQRFNPALTHVERNELVWQARKSASTSIDYLMLIIMAAALASMGLLLNSVAVIIGAMLVAPLMTPLGALATGMATGQLDITRQATVTLLQGVLLALIFSFLAGLILPTDYPTSEMLARGNPSLLDAGVALASGFVAAFAIARKEIPVALAGVAIAAALMPPVCTIGLGLALGLPNLAGGATVLFVTNIVFIVVAQNIIFLWIGMRPGRGQEITRGVAAWWALLITLLILVVSLLWALNQQARLTSDIEQFLANYLERSQVLDLQMGKTDDGDVRVTLILQSEDTISSAYVADLQEELSNFLDRSVQLRVVALPIIGAAPPVEAVLPESTPELEVELTPELSP